MKIRLSLQMVLLLLYLSPESAIGGWKWLSCPGINIISPTSTPIFATGVVATVSVTLDETPGDCNGMTTYPYERWYWEVAGGNTTPSNGQGQTAVFTNFSKGPGNVIFELICRSRQCPDCNAEHQKTVPFCVEDGPYYGSGSCIQNATMSLGAINVSPAVVCLGEAITASATLTKTAGQKIQTISYDCSPSTETTNSESVSVTSGYSITGPYVGISNGLSCTFTPTNPGAGTIHMWCEDAGTSDCSVDPYRVTSHASYRVLQTDIVGHESGLRSSPGLEVPEEIEDDAQNIQIPVNDDNDDGISGSHQDNQDTSIGDNDNDIVAITLMPLVPRLQRGTMTLAVYPAECVRVFTSNGITLLADYSVDLASPHGNLSALVSQPVMVFLEGMNPGEDVVLSLTYTDGTVSCSDEVHLQVLQADLDVDSENDSGFGATGWTEAEDREEDDETLPGKYIGVNDGDIDEDGIPNFADGYDLWGPGSDGGGNFIPMALELKEPIDLDTAKITFTYSCSDPKDVTRSGAGTDADPYRYTPAPGHLRIWKVDGSANRRKSEVVNSGDFIKSNEPYTAQDLWVGSDRTVVLYIEGINSSDNIGDQRILVEVAPDPDRPLICPDAVRCTVLKAAIVPDWNHDRMIDDSDRDHATAINPFRFWINDDNDDGDVADGNSDVPDNSNGNAVADNMVNGRCDLLDFFPVWLDISKAMELLPSDCVYVLRQADGAVNFFHSKLSRENAGDYLIEESLSYGWGLNWHAREIQVWNVPASGFDIDIYGTTLSMEIEADPNKGVLILEGKVPTTSPLVLEIRKGSQTGALLYQTQLPLSLSGVEEMYRWINLRPSGGLPTSTGVPANHPDLLSNGTNVFFLHGFNVDANAARGWNAEMFKRLYQAGSRAKFWGMEWEGDVGLVNELYYQEDVASALYNAGYFSAAIGGVTGDKIVLAHSLGNMVISAAIQDYGLSVNKYFMLNAAVATECYRPASFNDVTAGNYMLNEDWVGYNSNTWCSSWFRLYSFPDDRANLTWKGRFPSVVPVAYNFYSSGDEIFQVFSNGTPSAFSGGPFHLEQFAWQKQEHFKGRTIFVPYIGEVAVPGGTDWAGWGFSGAYSLAEANAASEAQLRTNAVFRQEPATMFSSNITAQVQNDIIAQGVPALSCAAGVNAINLIGFYNYNVNEYTQNGWGRSGSPYYDRWLHSDLKNMAYLYTYELFNQLVSQGGLQ